MKHSSRTREVALASRANAERRGFKRPRQAFIVLICALVLAGCGILFPFAELHYKLAVDIDIGGTIYHGERVYLVAFQSQGPILIGNTPQWSVGVVSEAFPIELGDRGMLFVLMHPDLVHRAFQSGRKSYLFRTAEAGRQALLS